MIGNRFEGYDTITSAWLPALNIGLREEGFPPIEAEAFTPIFFGSITPAPANGRGAWPHVRRWVNIADGGDIGALEKNLSACFGPVEDVKIYNGWVSHDVRRYLTARETGRTIGEALVER